MPRQNQARLVPGADRDPQRGLLPGVIHDALTADAERGKVTLDVIDQRQVGTIAHRVEGDEVGQHFADKVGTWGLHEWRHERERIARP